MNRYPGLIRNKMLNLKLYQIWSALGANLNWMDPPLPFCHQVFILFPTPPSSPVMTLYKNGPLLTKDISSLVESLPGFEIH